ncbi:MAG TPA: long-chain fatty acid--CoA ligase [Pyrinomonadaceae bacterium]|jgi:long-chain acyl-CoA synthetase|nr:long-chain fatty acid--CoA ligase [Pyrinomonadaceae bacterium]
MTTSNNGISQTPTTLPKLCLAAIRQYAKADALNHKRGGEWINIPAETFIERVRAVAVGLASLGVKAGDRIGLLSENRPEWSITDLAILSLGAVNVPIYTTQAVEQVRYILEDSGARLLFVSGRKVFKHARAGIESVEQLERIIFFDAEAAEGTERAMTLDALENRGAERDRREPEIYDRFVEGVGPEDLATIIYTSGTTGEPKGVMLTHDNFVSNVLTISREFPISDTDISLSVLPLSHIFERTVFYVFCWNGVSVYYAASFDQVGEHLREVRPTVMTAVPRLFEKVYHRIVKKGTSAGGWKSRVFTRALAVGQRYAEVKDRNERVPPLLEIQQGIANWLVFSKWRAGVGGRLRYFISGGAPLSPALSYAFLAADIPILQGFGMTETCIVSANRTEDNRVGSVGLPFPGIDVRLAADGEILVRGPNVMRGYYNHPESTRSAMTDGWFATGDVGRMDERGHLYITDRKKDLFKLSNGKYVAPQLIESLVKQSEFVNQVVVVGAGRKQPVALVVPDWESLASAMGANSAPNAERRAELSREPAAIKIVQRDVAALTASLADYERVRRVALLPEEFSIDGGEMTPTLKVKRRVIDEKYGALIDALYGVTE